MKKSRKRSRVGVYIAVFSACLFLVALITLLISYKAKDLRFTYVYDGQPKGRKSMTVEEDNKNTIITAYLGEESKIYSGSPRIVKVTVKDMVIRIGCELTTSDLMNIDKNPGAKITIQDVLPKGDYKVQLECKIIEGGLHPKNYHPETRTEKLDAHFSIT